MKVRLNVPLFLASLVAILIGAPILGLIGVWGFYLKGLPVPYFLKTLHAHLGWWSLVILISSLIIPSVNLKPLVRKFIILASFILIPLYVVFITLHHNSTSFVLDMGFLGSFNVSLYGFGAFVCEILFFASMIIVVFLASGLRIPFLQTDKEILGIADVDSGVNVPRKAFLVYGIFLTLSVIVGLILLAKFELQEKPITPAALTQLHTHTGIFSVGFILVIIALSAIGIDDRKVNFAFLLGTLALFGTFVGLLVFNLFDTHSIVWVLPAILHFALFAFGWISLFGVFGIKIPEDNNYFKFIRWGLVVIWAALMVYMIAGPYLSLKYDTSSNLTVTYKQPDGGIDGKHIGPYPDTKNYQGTAPVKHNPRGLENFHLSPGSWSHVAVLWLLVLLIFGKEVFQTIGLPNLIFALVVTIVEAPIFNSIGRVGAWLDLPGGIGPLILVAQPLKLINILSLITVFTLFVFKKKSS